jgi:hypothetical protein
MFYTAEQGQLTALTAPPAGAAPIATVHQQLLPPQITLLHQRFRAWGDAGMSPGPVTPARTWCGLDGQLAFAFQEGHNPQPLTHVGLARELAAWLVMLDLWMETFVVVARARSVWPTGELAAALSFATPAFLPPALLTTGAGHWQRVAQALARVVVEGALPSADVQPDKSGQPQAAGGALP